MGSKNTHFIYSLWGEGSLQFLKQADTCEGQCMPKELQPWLQDLLGRNISVSMWALRVPGLAVKSRHGLGDFPLVLFSTAVHTFFCVLPGGRQGREKGRDWDAAQERVDGNPLARPLMFAATRSYLTSNNHLAVKDLECSDAVSAPFSFWGSIGSVVTHSQIQKLPYTRLNLEARMGKDTYS